MAVDAGGCYQQAALRQAFSMDAHAVLLYNVVLTPSIGDSGFLSSSMTAAAQCRDILFEDRRILVVFLLGPVGAVTIRTIGSTRIPACVVQAMLTLVIELNLFGMAHRTVHLATVLTDRFPVLVDIRVALDAGIAAVGGMDYLFLVDIKGDHFAVPFLPQLPIGMAGHTKGIGETLLVEDTANLVRLVAVDAAGYLMRFLLPEFAPYYLQVDLFDLCMALHTGRCNVVPVDR